MDFGFSEDLLGGGDQGFGWGVQSGFIDMDKLNTGRICMLQGNRSIPSMKNPQDGAFQGSVLRVF